MRRQFALMMAVGTAIFVIAISFLFARLAQATEDPVEKGKEVYQSQRCKTCHSISGDGNKKHPLDGAGSRLSAADIRKWIVTPQEMDPKVKKKGYTKLSDQDLDALVAYILSLKS